MGNCGEATKPDGTSDDAIALEVRSTTQVEELHQSSQTCLAAGFHEHKSALSLLEPDPTKSATSGSNSVLSSTTAKTTVADLPIVWLAAVVRQFDIRHWKQLELVSRQFRAAVLMAWRDLRTLRLESAFGYEFGNMLASGREASRQQKMLTKFLEMLLTRSPFIAEYRGLFHSNSRISSQVVQQICRFHTLKRLHLYRLEHSWDDLFLMERLVASFRNNNVLQTLSHNEGLSEVLRVALSKMALQELVYRSTSLDRGKCLLEMNCDELTTLNLGGSEIDVDVLNQLLPRCKKLTLLDLSATQHHPVPLSENNFFKWLRTANTLKTLRLNFFVENDSHVCGPVWYAQLRRSLSELGGFGALTNLTMMDCCFCTSDMLDMITDRLSNSLKVFSFDITNCSEAALLKLARRMVNLEDLGFSSWKGALEDEVDCNNVTNSVLYTITANLSKLRRLDLKRPSASADALKSLIELNELRDLTVVGQFDEETLITVVSAVGHQLLALQIPESKEISDTEIVAAAKQLPKLRLLNLSDIRISDKSLNALSRYCPELRELYLTDCPLISCKGVRDILSSCQKMERLALDGSSVNVDELKKCTKVSRRYQQVALFDTLCCRYFYSSPCVQQYSDQKLYWSESYFTIMVGR